MEAMQVDIHFFFTWRETLGQAITDWLNPGTYIFVFEDGSILDVLIDGGMFIKSVHRNSNDYLEFLDIHFTEFNSMYTFDRYLMDKFNKFGMPCHQVMRESKNTKTRNKL